MEEITQLQKVLGTVIDFCVRYSFQIVGALIILGLGLYFAGWMSRLILRVCERKGVDVTLTSFLARFVKVVILTFVIIMSLGKFGISVAPLIAALGAMAFGTSFALQGPLSNYGAGFVIIVTRPFVVGNTIAVDGVNGVVEAVTLSTTVLSTADGEQITIPNKKIVGEVLTNSFENKIVETSIGISYDDDPEKAIRILREVLSAFPNIPSTPAPQIGIDEYADSAIALGMRYWVPTKEYFEMKYAINLAIYKEFKDAGITIPYPQRDVHIISN